MRVTRLELLGFKSFADKTRLDFTPGVTAVVGPNGCGKSNIADAIRWVFGEQRPKALRGGSMEDVIFAGTDRRHPLGMSEVALTIDNADGRLNVAFAEVSIARRRYRSGESEYFINKAPCRYRDILDLLMDTGMGLDSYSYIEQGRIDMVLSSKPEDRRMIFEDAAGIVRYRKRQAEALRKLERTDLNLARLADTIQEVQRRCRSLKRQAAAAQRYRTLQDELRVQELRLARYQYDQYEAELRAQVQKLHEATDALEGVGARVSSEEAAIEQGRLRQLELEGVLSHAQQNVYALETEIDRAEAHIRVLDEKRRAAEERANAASAELAVLTQRADELAGQAAHAQAEVERSGAQVAQSSEAVQASEQEMAALGREIAAAEGRLERERQESLRILNEKIAAENRRASVANQIEMIGGRLARVSDQIKHAEQQVAAQARRLAESRARIARLTREREATRATLERAEADRRQCFASRAGAETELARLREELSAARSKLRSLEQLRDQFEGFHTGVKTVLTAARDGAAWTTGVRGVLADLVTIPRGYEVALEAALGSHVQTIVTNTVADAERCIGTLQEANSGRVTCLPLSGLKPTPWVRSLLPKDGTPGIVGWAAELVRADEVLRPAIRHLLGNTLIVESPEVARTLAFVLRPTPRFVTPAGEVIESSGIRSGGVAAGDTGLISRHNEIAELHARVGELERHAANRAETIAELEAELHDIEARVSELTNHAGSLDLEIRGLEQDCHRGIEALDTARRQMQQVRGDADEILRQRAELLSAREGVARDIARVAEAEADVQTRVLEAQSRLGELLGRKESLNQQLTQRQVERSAAEHALQAHRRDAERIAGLRAETEERLAKRREEVELSHVTCAEVDRDVADTRERIQRRNLDRVAAQEKVTDLQQERGGLVHQIGEREQVLRAARHEYQHLTDQAHQLDLQVTRLRDRLGNLRDHIITAYQVDLTAAPELFTQFFERRAHDAEDAGSEQQELDVWEPETAAQLVADLKQRLEKMGPVNLIAIEEYEEYQARCDFLEQQDADLKAARQTLLSVIREINTTIEKKFLETFAQIQEHFHEIFRILFEGGRAKVTLSDPEHPLESGIDIDVQPPGKHPQSISLLSGGERALTASALLFAVFKTRPSPFCILDEVDAPLDDTNVIRLCRLIEKFAEQTQFIIITHNKRTMELADTLYGVTMEERGVSQLVSVKLTREAEPTEDLAVAAA